MEFRIAHSDEKEIVEEFLAKQYANLIGLPHYLPDDATTFIAIEDKIVGTISLSIRNFIGRVSRLAIANSKKATIGLMGIMAQYAHANGVKILIANINPKHREFYTKIIGFRVYDQFTYFGHPALKISLDLDRLVVKTYSKQYKVFFGKKLI